MSAPFYEVRFPDHIAVGAEAVVRSRTSIVPTSGAQERRNKRWSSQLREWDAARGIRYTSDLEAVRAFHIVMDGRHAGFRFKDFSDYSAADQRLDTSAGGTVFQLRKGYTAAGVTKWRTIKKPVPGTVRLTLNGEPVDLIWTGPLGGFDSPVFGESLFGETFGGTGSIDHTTGLITMTEALSGSDVLLATFEFDCPARFGSDELKVRARARGKIWEWGPIPIRELRQ